MKKNTIRNETSLGILIGLLVIGGSLFFEVVWWFRILMGIVGILIIYLTLNEDIKRDDQEEKELDFSKELKESITN